MKGKKEQRKEGRKKGWKIHRKGRWKEGENKEEKKDFIDFKLSKRIWYTDLLSQVLLNMTFPMWSVLPRWLLLYLGVRASEAVGRPGG